MDGEASTSDSLSTSARTRPRAHNITNASSIGHIEEITGSHCCQTALAARVGVSDAVVVTLLHPRRCFAASAVLARQQPVESF